MNQPARSLLRELGVVALAVIGLHWLGNLGDGFLIGTFDDDGVYTVLGKALAEGRGYLSLHLVGSPVQVKYPPGFPWILSLVWRGTGSVDGVQAAVRWLHPVVLAAAAGCLWSLARAHWRLGWGTAALFVLLPLVFDATIQYAAIPLAEPWFICGWAAVLLVWEHAGTAEGRRREQLLGLTGLLIAATTLVRSQGIVLLPALATALYLRRRPWREWAVALGAAVVPLALWQLYHRSLIAHGPLAELPDEGMYAAWFSSGGTGMLALIARSVRDNAWFYVLQIGDYLTATRPFGAILMGLGLLGMVAAGLALIRRQPMLAISVLGSLALVLLWPFAQDRLLLSTLPAGGLLIALGLEPWLARLLPKPRLWLNFAAVVMLILVLLRQTDIRRDSLQAAADNRPPKLLSPSYGLLVNSRFIATASYWIRNHTKPSAHIMIDHQSGIYLYAGRQTMPASPSESRLVPSVFSVPGRYLAGHILRDSLAFVIVGLQKPGIMRDLETVTGRCPGVLTWGGVSESDSRFIYRVRPDSVCLHELADR